MYRYFLIIFTFITCPVFAQDYPFNDTNWWERLVYEEKPVVKDFLGTDSAIIVISNRGKTGESLRFMSEVRGDGELLYFFVYAYKGKWHVLKVKDLPAAVKHMPESNRDWVVYTEGMGKIFTAELNRGMMMNAQYKVNVIMLDYPSITTNKKQLGNYLFSIKNARASYKDYVPVLKTIKEQHTQRKLGTGNMTLFFHSMGNYLMEQTVKKKQLQLLNDTVWANNIILNAPCVPQHHHAKWLNKIQFSKNIYVHYNPEDRTLYWPELFNKKKQLGRRLRKPLSSNAHYVNFHPVVGGGHSYFLTLRGRTVLDSVSFKHYNTILHGNSVDLSSKSYRPSSYRSIGVEILPD